MFSATRVVRNFPQHGGQELPMLPGHCASHTAFGACLGFGYGWSGLYLIPYYVVLPKRAKTVIWKMGNERTVMRKNKGGTEKKNKNEENREGSPDAKSPEQLTPPTTKCIFTKSTQRGRLSSLPLP